MSEAEQLAYAIQIAFFVGPTFLGALIGYAIRRRGSGAGIGAAVGFVLGTTAYTIMAIW